MYLRFTDKSKIKPTLEGREQFYYWESTGKYPAEPDPYFISLSIGKKWFSVQQEMLRKQFFSLTGDWPGLILLADDWKGERWVLRYLLSWLNNLPEWVYNEDYIDN